jgi:Icc-related predicted phosphoesterase
MRRLKRLHRADRMRCIAVSDTHNRAEGVAIPDGDVLLHAGDLTMKGTARELERAVRWLASLRGRFRAIIAIPGNHDFGIEEYPDGARARFLDQGITLLIDEPFELDGVTFYGSPWQPWFFDWAYNFPRDDGGGFAAQTWAKIPAGTDVVITHGPPHGILDRTERGDHAGCPHLLRELRERVRPKVHLFGHIHEGYGEQRDGETLYVNASTCDFHYAPTQPPIAFDVS